MVLPSWSLVIPLITQGLHSQDKLEYANPSVVFKYSIPMSYDEENKV